MNTLCGGYFGGDFEYFWTRIDAGVDLEEGCEGDHVEKNNYLRGH